MATMSDPTSEESSDSLPSPPQALLRQQFWLALWCSVLLTVATGIVFPLVLTEVAQLFFPSQSNGTLMASDGRVIGSDLIGQKFTAPGYFHPRPSAAGGGYDATASSGSNLGPTNPKLRDDVRLLAESYRRQNYLPPDTLIPIDAVTSSGSGLDPHISPDNADLQIPRIAKVRGMSEEQIRILVAEHTQRRQFGFLGEPCISVLALNLALDRLAPLPTAVSAR